MKQSPFFPTHLTYPFSFSSNPHSQKVEKLVNDWLEHEYSFLPNQVKKKYAATGIAIAAGYMFPKATRAQLTTISRFFIWAFTVDDKFEYTSKKEVNLFMKKAFMHFKNPNLPTQSPLLLPIHQLESELSEMKGIRWYERWIESLHSYFEGLAEETYWRKAMKFPPTGEFINIRVRSVNVFPLVLFAEAITGKILPKDFIEGETNKKLSEYCCRILSWANDYYSAHLEEGKEVINLVLLFREKYHSTLQEAADRVLGFHDNDVIAFLCLCEDAIIRVKDEGVRKYVENLKLMISGYLEWTLTKTMRYQKGGHPSIDFNEKKAK